MKRWAAIQATIEPSGLFAIATGTIGISKGPSHIPVEFPIERASVGASVCSVGPGVGEGVVGDGVCTVGLGVGAGKLLKSINNLVVRIPSSD